MVRLDHAPGGRRLGRQSLPRGRAEGPGHGGRNGRQTPPPGALPPPVGGGKAHLCIFSCFGPPP